MIMKILQVNKFYYPRRGADKYFLFLEKVLTERGHQVRVFSMKGPNNLDSKDKNFFSNNVDLHTKNLKDKFKAAKSVIYNLEAKKKFTSLLNEFTPDIIHCHNIYHQLSPSILDVARKKNIPVVMHLHDYKLICPNYKLYTKGKYCKRCLNGNYFQCTKYRCIDNNLIKSLLASIEMTIHHKFLKIYEKGVDKFIAPSIFIKNICLEAGWDEAKFFILENISPIKVTPVNKLKNYFLYFGALEEEKGIDLAIKAAARSNKELVIAGSGSYKSELEKLGKELNAKLKFTGQVQGTELEKLLSEALAIIIPSRWPENMPLAAIEAMSAAKTIIVSNMGGLPELVENGKTGYIFPTEDFIKLSSIMESISCKEAEKIGKEAFLSRQNKNLDWHYKELINIYNQVIEEKNLE